MSGLFSLQGLGGANAPREAYVPTICAYHMCLPHMPDTCTGYLYRVHVEDTCIDNMLEDIACFM